MNFNAEAGMSKASIMQTDRIWLTRMLPCEAVSSTATPLSRLLPAAVQTKEMRTNKICKS